MQVNFELIRQRVFEYIDKDLLVEKLKAVGATDLNPFKLHPDSGKPIGFSKSLLETEGFVSELLYYLLWVIEKIVSDIGELASPVGKEKKRALIQILDESIRLPFFLEAFDGKIIGWVIDHLIEILNKFLGKDWLKNIPQPTLVKPKYKLPTPDVTDIAAAAVVTEAAAEPPVLAEVSAEPPVAAEPSMAAEPELAAVAETESAEPSSATPAKPGKGGKKHQG